MSFHSGRVTFVRFRVEGDAPATADATALATLAEHSFRESEIGAPDEVEAGWITGEHLFDTQFSYEKNGYGAGGDLLLFALRIDTHRVPSEVKHAFQRINEQALAAQNPSGFSSKRQRRDAAETADQQLNEELASGKYRQSKSVPVLWDLANKAVYCASAGNTVTELLSARFREGFNVELTPLTSGSLAGQLLRGGGKGRDYEDLHPSPFTPAPAAARLEHAETADGNGHGGNGHGRDLSVPSVPWVASSLDLKDFLGNEFLVWLWWTTETAEGLIDLPNATGTGTFTIAVAIDKALDMDCAWGVLGKQTLRATGPSRLAEAGEALATGKWPRKLSLIVADTADGEQWELSLQGDRWIVSAVALPEVPEASSPRELVEARLNLTRKLADTLDGLYGVFLKQRVGAEWPARRGAIREWIQKRQG